MAAQRLVWGGSSQGHLVGVTLGVYEALALHQLRKDIIQDASEVVNKALNGEGTQSEREKHGECRGLGLARRSMGMCPLQSQY